MLFYFYYSSATSKSQLFRLQNLTLFLSFHNQNSFLLLLVLCQLAEKISSSLIISFFPLTAYLHQWVCTLKIHWSPSALQLFGTAESLIFQHLTTFTKDSFSLPFVWRDLMTCGVKLMTLRKIVSIVQSLCLFFLKSEIKTSMWSKYFYLSRFLNDIKCSIPRQNK